MAPGIPSLSSLGQPGVMWRVLRTEFSLCKVIALRAQQAHKSAQHEAAIETLQHSMGALRDEPCPIESAPPWCSEPEHGEASLGSMQHELAVLQGQMVSFQDSTIDIRTVLNSIRMYQRDCCWGQYFAVWRAFACARHVHLGTWRRGRTLIETQNDLTAVANDVSRLGEECCSAAEDAGALQWWYSTVRVAKSDLLRASVSEAPAEECHSGSPPNTPQRASSWRLRASTLAANLQAAASEGQLRQLVWAWRCAESTLAWIIRPPYLMGGAAIVAHGGLLGGIWGGS